LALSIFMIAVVLTGSWICGYVAKLSSSLV